MHVWRIAYYTVRRNLFNWKIFLLLILLPFVFYLICLNVAPNIDQDPKWQKAGIAYFSSGSGPIARQFEQFLRTEAVLSACAMQKADSIAAGNRLVREGKVEAFIYLSADAYLPADSGRSQDPASNIKMEIFSNGNSPAAQLLAENFGYAAGIPDPAGKMAPDSAIARAPAGIQGIAVSLPGKVLREADKYPFLGLLEMFSYGALLSSFAVINSRKTNILTRMNMAPINRFTFAGGQLLGNLITLCPSGALFIAYIAYVWGDALQGKLPHIILTFVLFTAIITALGMIIGYLCKRTGLSALAVVSVNALSLGAAFVWALGSAQGFFKSILCLSPHYHTYVIVTDAVFKGSLSRMQSSFTAMILIAAVFIVFALMLGRRKRV